MELTVLMVNCADQISLYLSVLKFILLYALTCHTAISRLCILLPEVNVT